MGSKFRIALGLQREIFRYARISRVGEQNGANISRRRALPRSSIRELTPTAMSKEKNGHCHLDYVPVRTLCGNQTYLLAALFAYNLTRELQMETTSPCRATTMQRATLWAFEKLDTLRKTLIQRAGRLTHPNGTFTLTVSANSWIKQRIVSVFRAIPAQA